MNKIEFLKSKVNKYSVIGSIAYGAICAFTSTYIPNPPFRFYSIYTFTAAVLFYFGMYIWYTKRKRRTWPEFGMLILNISIKFIIGYVAVIFVYIILFRVSLDTAINNLANIIYYMPFLP